MIRRALRGTGSALVGIVLLAACTQVSGEESFTTVAGGEQHTCALTEDGDIWCWGANRYGQLGNGTTSVSSGPTKVRARVSFRAVSAGKTHTCAIDIAGGAWCWGGNFVGKLGTGDTTSSPLPVKVVGLPGPVELIDVTADRSCATTAKGLWCWGDNTQGVLGIDDARPLLQATRIATGDVTALAVSPGRGCLLASIVLCSGIDTNKDLGGEGAYRGVHIDDLPPDVVELFAGQFLLCARTRSEQVYCWGSMTWSLQPDGTWLENIWLPATRLEGARAEQMSMMDSTVCTLLDGNVTCRGARPGGDWIRIGGAGIPDFTSDSLGEPWNVEFPPGVTAIGGGAAHLCAVNAGDVWCFGRNDAGQLGDGTTLERPAPIRVPIPG
jgi:hypothetical protein